MTGKPTFRRIALEDDSYVDYDVDGLLSYMRNTMPEIAAWWREFEQIMDLISDPWNIGRPNVGLLMATGLKISRRRGIRIFNAWSKTGDGVRNLCALALLAAGCRRRTGMTAGFWSGMSCVLVDSDGLWIASPTGRRLPTRCFVASRKSREAKVLLVGRGGYSSPPRSAAYRFGPWIFDMRWPGARRPNFPTDTVIISSVDQAIDVVRTWDYNPSVFLCDGVDPASVSILLDREECLVPRRGMRFSILDVETKIPPSKIRRFSQCDRWLVIPAYRRRLLDVLRIEGED